MTSLKRPKILAPKWRIVKNPHTHSVDVVRWDFNERRQQKKALLKKLKKTTTPPPFKPVSGLPDLKDLLKSG